MKSEHRHELKTNELAEWLGNFPQWAKENLRMIIYVTVVIVAVAGVYVWNNYQKNLNYAADQDPINKRTEEVYHYLLNHQTTT